jgi:hypothetical protein
MIGITESRAAPGRLTGQAMPKYATVASALVMAMSAPALAQPVAGSYEVKFEEMSTNCDPVLFTYKQGVVKVDTAKSSMRVNIDTLRREMAGVPQKSGKISAKTPKKVPTTIEGVDGKYGVSGRVDDQGVLELVLVAELFRHDNGKPLCTQSWNVRGVRQTASTDKPKDQKQKKSASVTSFEMMPALLVDN